MLNHSPRNSLDQSQSVTDSLAATAANGAKLQLLHRVVRDQLAAALARGFHGTTSIELSVQDGTIQHIRHRIERTER
jgi:hypothetical protein